MLNKYMTGHLAELIWGKTIALAEQASADQTDVTALHCYICMIRNGNEK